MSLKPNTHASIWLSLIGLLSGLAIVPTQALAQANAVPAASASATAPSSRDELRDPSAWPAELRSPAPGSADTGSDDGGKRAVQHITIREGKAFVVAGGRLLPVGGKLGDATIVRIDSQAVWLRDGRGTRREAIYPGIDKHAAVDPVPSSAAPRAPKPAAKPRPRTPSPSATMNSTTPSANLQEKP